MGFDFQGISFCIHYLPEYTCVLWSVVRELDRSECVQVVATLYLTYQMKSTKHACFTDRGWQVGWGGGGGGLTFCYLVFHVLGFRVTIVCRTYVPTYVCVNYVYCDQLATSYCYSDRVHIFPPRIFGPISGAVPAV